MLILAPTGDDNGKKGEPAWLQKDRGYTPHTEAGELYNLAKDPAQKDNRYAAESAVLRPSDWAQKVAWRVGLR